MLVHRDTETAAAYRLRFAAAVDSARVLAASAGDTGGSVSATGPGPALSVRLEPGGAVVIAAWRTPSASSRSTPSRSGTR